MSSPHELEPGAVRGRGKRLGATEVADRLLEALTHPGSSSGYVELTRNAKGNTQIAVKVPSGESEAIATTEEAEPIARAIYDRLCEAYPMLEEPEPAPRPPRPAPPTAAVAASERARRGRPAD